MELLEFRGGSRKHLKIVKNINIFYTVWKAVRTCFQAQRRIIHCSCLESPQHFFVDGIGCNNNPLLPFRMESIDGLNPCSELNYLKLFTSSASSNVEST